MALSEWFKDHYHWQDVKIINEQLIETENGRKRLHLWSDKELLDWHIEWRDRCSVTPYVLADRMIRNRNQEAFSAWNNGWLTIHDDVSHSYDKECAEQIGMTIGAMIQHGKETHSKVQPSVQTEPAFPKLQRYVSRFEDRRLMLLTFISEAKSRMKKAEALIEHVNEPLPLLDPIRTTEQVKKMYQIVIWYGTNEYPERGYRSLRQFLSEFLHENGEESFKKLLDGMYTADKLTREQAILLLAECLKPYELDPLVRVAEHNPTKEEIECCMNQVERDWESSRKLVQLISASIDKKKVAIS
ncbi:hypothetical protein GN156_03270 [bacterium LRH843]|nr:hypothetical protein [bacterium LRH843]